MKTKQTGSIMIEAAYILPILMLVVFLVFEILNYSIDRLLLNNILSDINKTVLIETSALVAGEDPSNLQLVACTADKVTHDVAAITDLIETNVKNSSILSGVALPDGFNVQSSTSDVANLETLVIKASYPIQTQFVPENLTQALAVHSTMITTSGFPCDAP
ncbi:MAG: TadE/TadG family type IV pilus assembly protein [Hydrogenovibrio sp.]|uniref:TadE family protein n=1 Tax=Hydrogenovibrio sp. TaxID=2065821 RepID=UPI00287077AD|nr:TadE/TadG family type IV pilus assembly protein [Hydrogenovibrio sp.]MDR9497573.1 TadE/TadG family type IV pilus assembly protein [Hydrogenovibrio sp.]